jgi:hypothetical protein
LRSRGERIAQISSATAVRSAVGTCKSGSVEDSGTFIAAIKARSQSIG